MCGKCNGVTGCLPECERLLQDMGWEIMTNSDYRRVYGDLQQLVDDATFTMTSWHISKLRIAITAIIAGDYEYAAKLLELVRQGPHGEELPSNGASSTLTRTELRQLLNAVAA